MGAEEWFDAGVRGVVGFDECEAGSGGPGGAGDGDAVAEAGAVASEEGVGGPAVRDGVAVLRASAVLGWEGVAVGGDGDAGVTGANDVAAGDADVVGEAGFEHALCELVEVLDGDVGAEAEADEKGVWLCAHGGEVRDVGGDGPPCDVGEGHGVGAPVGALGEDVQGGDGSCAGGDAPGGGVVAGWNEDVTRGGGSEALRDAVDECELAEGGEWGGGGGRHVGSLGLLVVEEFVPE